MSMLTDKGFKRQRYADIVASLESRAKEKFGEDVNLSERQFLGIFIRIIAFFLSRFAQDLEDTYNSSFYQTADGVSLDKNAHRQGFSRQPEIKARGKVIIEGDDGTRIDAGFIVGTPNEVNFVTTEDVRINGDSVEVEVEAIEAGQDGNVPAGAISEIVTPIVGVSSVVNPEPTSGGRDRETDAELRERIRRVREVEGRLVLQLLDVEGVRDVYLDYNDSSDEVNGLPPHSIAPIVWGGDEEEIAQTIARYKSAGIRSFGDVEITVTDSKTRDHIIGFSRPTVKEIYVKVYVEGSVTPEEVRTAIIAYIGGQDEDGTEYDGLGINEDVIHFRALHEIGKIGSVTNATLEWSTDGSNYHMDDIEIARTEYATTDWQKVDVTVV